jgi:hypothetical protein
VKPAWNRRQVALGAALVATLAAVLWASRLEPQAVVAARAPAANASAPAALPPPVAGLRLEARRAPHRPQADAFAARSFYVPPPAPKRVAAPVAPPPPPSAPPLPFTYVGMLKEAGGTVAFVTRGEQLYTLRVGELVDASYRVEAIEVGGVTFRYLPLNETQTLKAGDAS